MDEIKIDGLKIFAHHGYFPGETVEGQNFVINALLTVDNGNVGESDDLEEVTNYAEVVQEITDEMANTCKLIEAAAEHIALRILKAFPLVKKVWIELCKPEAPIPADFQSVSVRLTRERHRVYIGVGSNMGDKDGYIDEAISCIQLNENFSNVRAAKVITTKPYGKEDQAMFRNTVIEADTLLKPMQLLDYLHMVEEEAGRERKEKWGPRTLDLDILLYDDRIIDEEKLIVPHVDMHNRDFVLGPMIELRPHLMHPLLHKTMEELYSALPER